MTTPADISAAPEAVLREWYASWPPPKTDTERDLMERLCVRVEALGLIDDNGKLK